jgi:hypothetical protein
LVILEQPHFRKREILQDDLKVLCCDEPEEFEKRNFRFLIENLTACKSFHRWTAGARLARHGGALRENYETTQQTFDELVRLGAVDRSLALASLTSTKRSVQV